MAPIRIRTLLALTMGGLTLVATAAVLGIALYVSAQNTFELFNDRIVLVIDNIENEVRGKLRAASQLAEGYTREVRMGSLRGASPGELHDAMSVALAASPDVGALLYWDGNLVRRTAFRQADGIIGREGPAAEDNPRIQTQLRVLPSGAKQWGAPLREGDFTYMNYAVNVGRTEPDIAFVAAVVSLEQFSSFIADIGRDHGATAFMLYGEDEVLAHPDFVESSGPIGHAMVPIASAGDPVLANLANGVPLEFAGSARRQYVETFRVEADGVYYMVIYRWLYGFGPQPLAVGAYFPRAQVSDAIFRLVISAVAGVGIALVAVVVAIVLGGFIARPVRRLAESASAVARFDLAGVERPPRSPIAEVDEQGRAFGLMLDALTLFGTYVPRKLVERLVEAGGGQEVASETREVTVMFTDMVHFSEISERMGAEETATFLNRHFGLVVECIEAEGGTIDKYIGDAVMAFWGAPDSMEDHAARAVAAARGIAATMTADNARRARKGLRPVRVRVGIHTGSAVVGNIGVPDRLNYTIVGDTVNDAQRLEALGRDFDAGADVTVLISAETARLAGLGSDETDDVGEHLLAGTHQLIAVRRLRWRAQQAREGRGKRKDQDGAAAE